MEIDRMRVKMWKGNKLTVREYNKHQNKDETFTLVKNGRYDMYKMMAGQSGSLIITNQLDPLIVPDDRIKEVRD